jgi:CNT family concentrative nucleoside transporter
MKPDDLTRPEPVIDIMAVEDEGRPANVIDAAASGAAAGLKIAAIIGAMLVAFVALIAMLNGMVGGLASLAGFEGITMDLILGKLLSPVMYLLGIPWQDAAAAGNLVGQKFILNEFVAYAQLQQIKDSLDPHTVIVSTFALCGFANLSSIAILLGGLGAMAPTRKAEIARMGFKAVVAGFLSNMMSAALVSLLLSL